MNYEDLVNILGQQTENKVEICIDIIDAYEKYCTVEMKLPFQKEVDIGMINWISEETGYDVKNVTYILNELVAIVRKDLVRKIPFMK